MRFDYKNTHHFIYVSKVHCGSSFGPRASGLPYYCAPLVCVFTGFNLGGIAAWWLYKQTNKQRPTRYQCLVSKPGSSLDPVNLLSRCFGYCSPLVQWDCKRNNVTKVLKDNNCLFSERTRWRARGRLAKSTE